MKNVRFLYCVQKDAQNIIHKLGVLLSRIHYPRLSATIRVRSMPNLSSRFFIRASSSQHPHISPLSTPSTQEQRPAHLPIASRATTKGSHPTPTTTYHQQIIEFSAKRNRTIGDESRCMRFARQQL